MTEFFDPVDETLAEELAINEAFPVKAVKHMSAAERLRRQMATEEYWFGGLMPSDRIHRSLGTPHLGDDMFEHM